MKKNNHEICSLLANATRNVRPNYTMLTLALCGGTFSFLYKTFCCVWVSTMFFVAVNVFIAFFSNCYQASCTLWTAFYHSMQSKHHMFHCLFFQSFRSS